MRQACCQIGAIGKGQSGCRAASAKGSVVDQHRCASGVAARTCISVSLSPTNQTSPVTGVQGPRHCKDEHRYVQCAGLSFGGVTGRAGDGLEIADPSRSLARPRCRRKSLRLLLTMKGGNVLASASQSSKVSCAVQRAAAARCLRIASKPFVIEIHKRPASDHRTIPGNCRGRRGCSFALISWHVRILALRPKAKPGCG